MIKEKGKIKDILEDVSFWIKYSFIGKSYNFLRRFPKNVKTIIDWIPVLWENFDWDNHYLEEIIVFKLKRMERMFRNDGVTVNSVNYANEMKFVIDCLETNDDWYLDDQHRKLDEKYGKVKIESSPCEDHPGWYTVDINRTKCNTEELKEEERKEFLKIVRLEDEIRSESKRMAFDIIKDRIDYWWD